MVQNIRINGTSVPIESLLALAERGWDVDYATGAGTYVLNAKRELTPVEPPSRPIVSDAIIKAVEDEPEFPDGMSYEMYNTAISATQSELEDIFRSVVREIKDSIITRLNRIK